MSTATAERVGTQQATEWGPWIVGSNGGGQRNCFVLRHQDASDHNSSAEYHVNGKGDAIKYTMAGAEKKARELNQLVTDARRRDAYFAKRDAERQQQLDMAREVREVAQCGTLNSEAIARWIIGNFTWTDEVIELREERNEAMASAENERDSAKWAEEQLEKVQKRCNDLAEEARGLLTELGAYGPPLYADPLEFAAGSTPLEKVCDLSRDLLAALAAYDMEG